MELQSELGELYQTQMENRHLKETISSLREDLEKPGSFMTYAFKRS
jgi:hypothetical protein